MSIAFDRRSAALCRPRSKWFHLFVSIRFLFALENVILDKLCLNLTGSFLSLTSGLAFARNGVSIRTFVTMYGSDHAGAAG